MPFAFFIGLGGCVENIHRCGWCEGDALYIDYHDNEWGVPVYDDNKLFEFLILEGMQAGLSWITILKKREAFREAFAGFDPEKMARFSEKKIEALMQNKGIVRNQLKIRAAVTNAQAFLRLQSQESFSAFLWGFVNGEPIVNHWQKMDEVPVSTPQSGMMSKSLKKQGFKFVGATICYAFMQAVGMVNDHLAWCDFK